MTKHNRDSYPEDDYRNLRGRSNGNLGLKITLGLISFILTGLFEAGTIVWQMSHQNDRIAAVETNQIAMQADIKAEEASRMDTNVHLATIEQYIKDVRDDAERARTTPAPAVYLQAPQQQPAQVIMQAPAAPINSQKSQQEQR
jgi:hypothetical protein